MRRLITIALACLLLAALAPSASPQDQTLQIARVKVSNRAQGAFIANHFDETHAYAPGHVEVLLWPGDGAELDALGYDYEVIVPDVQARDRALFEAAPQRTVVLPGPDRTEYRVLADYENEMRELVDKHPSMVRLITLPNPSLEGRTVYGVEISVGVKDKDGRPTFHVDGVHHAREWPAGEYPMIFAHYLVDKFGKDKRVTRLLKAARVTIVPIQNVDGFTYSRSSLLNPPSPASLPQEILGLEAYWRKNRRSLSGITAPVLQTNPDAHGVDPNRNYSYHWGDNVGGSSSDITSQTYRGEAPFSEPESANIQTLLLSRTITGLVSNHTYSRLVIRPWGDTGRDALDEDLLARIGQKMADVMGGYRNIKGIQLYATTGTTSDYGYGVLGALSYTYEHGTVFHPPYTGEGSVATDYRGVIEAYMIGFEAAVNERYHAIVKGRVVDSAGRPVQATLTLKKTIDTPLWEGNPTGESDYTEKLNAKTATAGNGTFAWHMSPSTRPHLAEDGKKEFYTLIVTAKGLGTKTFKIYVERGDVLNLGTIRL